MEQDQNKAKLCRISYCVSQIIDFQAKPILSNIGTYCLLYNLTIETLVQLKAVNDFSN
jgi:hypothetical protein